MSLGKVDLNQIQVARTALGEDIAPDPNAPVLASVAFRKTWARTPSYWIEIVLAHHHMQIHSRWRWFDKNKNEWIEGYKVQDKPTTDAAKITALYTRLVREKLTGTGYIVDNSRGVGTDVVQKLEKEKFIEQEALKAVNALNNEQEALEALNADNTKKNHTPPPTLVERRGKFDVWD